MTPTRYTIVLDGPLQPDFPLDTLRDNLARLFKTDQTRIDALLAQGSVSIKKELSAEQAERYLDVLRLAGASARKEPEPGSAFSLEPLADSTVGVSAEALSPQASQMTCPKCGHQQAQSPECSACGIYVSKYLAHQARLQDTSPGESLSPYAAPRSAVSEPLPAFGTLRVFTTDGRIGRLRYLAWSLVLLLAMGVLFAVAGALMTASTTLGFVLMGLVGLLTLGLSVMIGVQRLHDLGWSGWWYLLNLVPIVGYVFPFLMLGLPGSDGPNRFGSPPPPNSRSVTWLAWGWIVVILLGIAAAVLVPSYMSLTE